MVPAAKFFPDRSDVSSEVVPSVVVVDPAFDSYKPLAESARAGRILLHFRSSGFDALRLARRHGVDAWLIATELDDMSGLDFVELLRSQHDSLSESGGVSPPKCVAMVRDQAGNPGQWEAIEAGADHTVGKPISFKELERLLGMSPEERQVTLSRGSLSHAFTMLPVSVGAAVVAIAVVMLS